MKRSATSAIKDFYESVYYRDLVPTRRSSRHLERLARTVGLGPESSVLDIACGAGQWLLAASHRGAAITGIDLSERAAAASQSALPEGRFCAGSAESLPFADNSFDVVTCLGSLEHFLDPERALREMVRVGMQGARFLLCVPNSEFLTRRLGLFRGTEQAAVQEHARSLSEWEQLFRGQGIIVERRWRDLHVLSWSWICRGRRSMWPARLLQALALTWWPLRWQYQVYYLARAAAEVKAPTMAGGISVEGGSKEPVR